MKKIIFLVMSAFAFFSFVGNASTPFEVNGPEVVSDTVNNMRATDVPIKERIIDVFSREEPFQYVFLTADELKYKRRRTLKGYRGFIDIGFFWWGSNDYADVENPYMWDSWSVRPCLSTAHGYQFNNYLFLGAGFEVGYFLIEEYFTMPMYADLKVNFSNTNISPYLDSRIGYFMGKLHGLYWSETFGLRFLLNKKRHALNVGVEFAMQECDRAELGNYIGVSTKIGFEF